MKVAILLENFLSLWNSLLIVDAKCSLVCSWELDTLGPVLGWLNPLHTLSHYFFKTDFNTVLLLHLVSQGHALHSIQWVPSILSPGIKEPGNEADHPSPSSAKVKNARSYTSTPQYIFTAWCSVP